MLIGLGVVESEEIFVFEQEGGRAGRKADLVHGHAAFKVVGNAINEARVSRNDISSFNHSACEKETEPGLRKSGRAALKPEFPVLINQLVEEGGGGG
jgi:hypothetical protein